MFAILENISISRSVKSLSELRDYFISQCRDRQQAANRVCIPVTTLHVFCRCVFALPMKTNVVRFCSRTRNERKRINTSVCVSLSQRETETPSGGKRRKRDGQEGEYLECTEKRDEERTDCLSVPLLHLSHTTSKHILYMPQARTGARRVASVYNYPH